MCPVRSVRRLAIATLGETVKGGRPGWERLQRRKALMVKELCDRYLTAAVKGLVLGKGGSPQESELALCRSRADQSTYRAAAGQHACAEPQGGRHQ
jgi:hypothetical protein